MKEHIHKIVRRYKGHVKYWDVVNAVVDVRRVVNEDESLKPDGSKNYVNRAFPRESPWYNFLAKNISIWPSNLPMKPIPGRSCSTTTSA